MSNVTIVIKGEDQASQVFKKVGDSLGGLGKNISGSVNEAGNAAGVFGRLGSAIGGMATVAGGIIAANVFGKITEGIAGFVKTGLQAVGASQQLDTSLNALFTSNMMYERVTEQVTTAVAKSAEQLAAEQEQLASLRTERDLQIARINEQKQKVWEMTNVWTEEGLATQTAKAKLADMEQQLASTDSEISKLENSTTEYATSTRESYKEVMSFEQAQQAAQDATKKLRAELDKIAVLSPFEAEQVEMVAKYAVQAGMSVDATSAFTAGFLDLASAVGIGSDSLGFAADQLLQVQKIGKITTIDLRQLRRLGIDLGKIIGVEMGMSIEEFNAKAEQTPEIFDELWQAVTRFSKNTFSGAAENFSKTLPGMMSQASDLIKIGARDLFTPIVEAVAPMALDIIGRMSSIFLGGGMADLGKAVAKMFGGIIKLFTGDEFAKFDFIQAMSDMGFGPDAIKLVADFVVQFQGWLVKAKETVANVFSYIASYIPTVMNAISQSITFVNTNWEAFKGALIGVGAVLAGGIIVGAITGLIGLFGALLSPVGLLIAAGAAIGAAWQTNWMGIRDVVTPIVETLLNQFNRIVQIFQVMGTEAGIQIMAQMVINAVQSMLSQGFDILVSYLTGLIPNAFNTTIAALQTAWEVIKAVFAGIVAGLQPLGESFARLTTVMAELGITWPEVWNALLTAVGIVAAGIAAAIVGIISVITGLITGTAEALAVGVEEFNNFVMLVTTALAGLQVFMTEGMAGIKALFSGDFPAALQYLTNAFDGLVIFISSSMQAILATITGPLNVVLGFFEGFTTSIIGFWQTLYDTLVGGSIVPDLVNEIIRWFGLLVEPVMGVFNTLSSGIGSILGAIFGGGENGEAMTVDFSGLLVTLTETIPAAIAALTEQFNVLWTTVTAQIMTMIVNSVNPFILLLVQLYTEHIPTLQTGWTVAMETMNAAMLPVHDAVRLLIQLLNEATAAVKALEAAFSSAMESVKDKVDGAVDKIGDLVSKVKDAAEAFRDMAEAAREAAQASSDAGDTAPGSSSGHQKGTGGRFFRVPGSGGSPFPLTVHAGEQVAVLPAGMARQQNLLGGRAVTNNWTVNINTAATSNDVEVSLLSLMAMVGNSA